MSNKSKIQSAKIGSITQRADKNSVAPLSELTYTSGVVYNTNPAPPITKVNRTFQTDSGTVVVETDKDVYVNTVENIVEQKYINNVTAGALNVGTVSGTDYTNVASGIYKLGFDADSGFDVTDLGAGVAKIAMNSTFKYWNVDGSPGLIACGLDTVNFVAGCNINIDANNVSVPKTLTFTGPTISAGDNIAIGCSGNTLTICGTSVANPGGCNTQFQYNNNGSFDGASGLTYDNATCSIGLTKITVPQDQSLQINVSSITKAWYATYGDFYPNNQDDFSSQVVYDADGNSYIIGSDGNDGVVVFLVKYDSVGNLLWQKQFSEVNNYYKTGDALAFDSDGNLLCVVGTDDSVNDVTVFKITPTGTILWQTTLSGVYIAGTDLIADSSNNVYACLFYDDGPNSQCLVKLNSSGVLEWQKVLSGNFRGFPFGIALDNTGNILITGTTSVDGTYNTRRFLLSKYDPSGNLLFQYVYATVAGTSVTVPGQITVDSSNNIYVAGKFDPGTGYDSGYVAKLDSSGNVLWQKNFAQDTSAPGYYYISFYGISLDTSGNVYIAGYGQNSPSTTGSDLIIVKLDNSGTVLWSRTFGGAENDYAWYYWTAKMIDVYQTSYVVTGYTYSASPGSSEAITFQMPTDGSQVGTYGFFTYAAANFIIDSNQFVKSTGTETASDGILVSNPGAYTLITGTQTNNTYKISGGDNVFTIGSTGTFSLPNYSLPFNSPSEKQTLVSCNNVVTWSDPSLFLNGTNSLRISSKSDVKVLGGANNFAVGYCSFGSSPTFGNNNFAVGYGALKNNSNGTNNIAIGCNSLTNAVQAEDNVALGYGSQSNNNGGRMNIGIGYDTLKNVCNSDDNIALGGCSQFSLITGNHNISLGWKSLQNHVCGNDNIAIGADSQNSNICGFENISLGSRSLYSNTTGYRNIAIGTYPLYRNTEGDGNIAIGIATLEYNTTGSGSVAIGEWALQNNRSGCMVGIGQGALSQNTTGLFNTAVGFSALLYNTTGWHNTAVGYGSLVCNITGSSNTAIGANAHRWGSCGSNNTAVGAFALQNNCGQLNTAVGASALIYNTTGQHNTAVGAGALNFNTTGQLNVAIGAGTLVCNTIGSANTAVGYLALNKNSTGDWNIAIGPYAAENNLVGQNIAIGDSALNQNTTGVNHVAIGSNALRYNTTGLNNTAVGNSALLCNTIGSCNFALGQSALRCNATGCANVAIGVSSLEKNCGSWNVAIGNGSLYQNTTGEFNLAIGANALENNTIGFRNVAIGRSSLLFNTCGGENMAIGFASLYYNTTGSFNTAIGGFAMYGNTTGCRNTAIGLAALRNSKNNENVAIGFNTLFNTSGACNTAIGASAGYGMTGGCNNTLIGWGTSAQTATSCNTITLGNSSITCIRAQVTSISTLSDQRDKTNVQNIPLGLQFVMDLRPVKFTWNMRDGAKIGVEDSGFIAQEVAALEEKYGAIDWLDMVGRENPEKLELKPAKLIPILVRAIQELNDVVTTQGEELTKLKSSMS